MRFFRRKEQQPPAPAEAVSDLADEEVEERYAADEAWSRRAAAVIAGGASTGSKRREALYGEGADFGPTHFERASGCMLVTAGGRELVDCTMALGSVAIGYGDERVNRSVLAALAAGTVCGLSSTLEVEVAERLC